LFYIGVKYWSDEGSQVSEIIIGSRRVVVDEGQRIMISWGDKEALGVFKVSKCPP
jgi:hypothetical protein